MRYTVLVAKPARKFLERLTDAGQRTRFERRHQRPRGKSPPRRLQSQHGAYRVRVGAYRVLYQIEDDNLLVLLTSIGSPGQIYR